MGVLRAASVALVCLLGACDRSEDSAPAPASPPVEQTPAEPAEPEPQAPDRSGIVAKIPKPPRHAPHERETYAGYTVELSRVAWEERENYLEETFLVLAVQARIEVTKDVGKPRDLVLKVTCGIDGAAHVFTDPITPIDGPSLKRRKDLVTGDVVEAKAEAFRLRSLIEPERCQLTILAQRSEASPVERIDAAWCLTVAGLNPGPCTGLVEPPGDDEPRWVLGKVVADPAYSYFDLRINEPLFADDRIALRTTCPDRKGIRTPSWDSRFWGWLAIHDVSVSPYAPPYGEPGVTVDMRLEVFRDLDESYELSASITCDLPSGEETKDLPLLSMGYLPLQNLHAGESVTIATSGIAGELPAAPRKCRAEIRARGVSDTVSLDWVLGTFCAKRAGKTKAC